MIEYVYQDFQLDKIGQISLVFTSVDGPNVQITDDASMLEALQVMKYPSLRAVSNDFVIRRHARPVDYEAFVSKLNLEVVTKILAELNYCQPEEIHVTFHGPTARDIREMARFVKSQLKFLEQ